MHDILRSYMRRLTNLSGNNRSLMLLRLISDQTLDMHALHFLNNHPSYHYIDQLMARKAKVPLCPIIDSGDADTTLMSRRLKKLQRMEQFIFEERGARDLYVGWPFVRGKFSDGTTVRCPLAFFPVKLVQQGKLWYLEMRQEVSVTLNKSFLLAYAHYNEVELDQDLLDGNLDELDKDGRVFRTQLYQLFRDSTIELHFNQENFMDELVGFKNYKKKDLEEATTLGELNVFPEAVLGIFPQAGSYLTPDYLTLLKVQDIQDIEDFFVGRSVAEDVQEQLEGHSDFRFLAKVHEEFTYAPFLMDAFQENALKAVKKGNSMVVQGPPGTGKSQLICNLICDFIARGKKVLLVSQKKAALDVVYQRLADKDLGDFIGLVHDFKNDRQQLYQSVARQVERLPEYQTRNNSLDAIQLERQFLQASRRIDQLTEELEEYKQALFSEKECGLSVKELYLSSDPHAPAIHMKQEYQQLPFDKVEAFKKKLRDYTVYAQRYENDSFPWSQRRPFSGFTFQDLKEIKGLLAHLPVYEEELGQQAKAIIGGAITVEEAEVVLSKKEKLHEMLWMLSDDTVYGYFQHLMQQTKEEMPTVLSLANTERVVLECYKGEGPEITLPTNELGHLQKALQLRKEARNQPWKQLRLRLFSKDYAFIKQVLQANELPNKRAGHETLAQRLDNRLNLEHNLTKIKKMGVFSPLPGNYELPVMRQWFSKQKQALSSRQLFLEFRGFGAFFSVAKLDYAMLKDRVERLLDLLEKVPPEKQRWMRYLTAGQIVDILGNPTRRGRMLETLDREFEGLCAFDGLQESLLKSELEVIRRLYDELGEVTEETAVTLFENSLRLAWIEYIEEKYPVLRSVSSVAFDRLVQELAQCMEQKQAVSNDILLLRLREQTYDEVEYNRLNNMVTYRDLTHQVTKKRQIWPLRKVVHQFAEELYKLVPCWMASPESASAIFPMEQEFDLVIFDEASQCYSEKGIPAMYRGKQVVIVGDSQQLAPNDLYKVRWDADQETESPAIDADSLLDLGHKYLMQVQLQGHYRSKALELIEFSNQAFYNGHLEMLPDRVYLNTEEPSIKYVKVPGVWEKKTNPVEGKAVVDLLGDLLNRHPEKTVGVVTFNTFQQALILDLLDDAAATRESPWPSSLFVKNIENVQGDERDIIVFSIGYAPDDKGKMNMQFGTLNQVKGENRLNVAITRAKERIIVVASIGPEDLKVEESKNEGPKLLKEYLAYAREVSQGSFKPKLSSRLQHPNAWFLKNHLTQWHQQDEDSLGKDTLLGHELPYADLTVRKQHEYLGMVLTDDDLYHGAISVKDAHVYKPAMLEEKQWPHRQIFSRNYWLSRDQVQENLQHFISLLQQ